MMELSKQDVIEIRDKSLSGEELPEEVDPTKVVNIYREKKQNAEEPSQARVASIKLNMARDIRDRIREENHRIDIHMLATYIYVCTDATLDDEALKLI